MFKHIKYTHKPVVDKDRAVSVYRDKLGLNVVQDTEYMGGWRWIELEIPGARTVALLTRRDHEEPDNEPCLALIADDVRACHADLKARGVTFVQEPAEAAWKPGQMFALIRDSENNLVLIASG